MKDAQLQAMSLARHHKILARARAAEAAAAASAETFAVPEPAAPVKAENKASIGTAQPPQALAGPEPARTLVTARPARAAEPPQLSSDQMALLAASLGADLTEPAAPPVAPARPPSAPQGAAAPDMSEAQLATLMAAFGQDAAAHPVAGPPPSSTPAADIAPQQAAAAMIATAIPQARDDNLRYFPVNRAREANAAQMTASDSYLRAMQQMERNLGAYGGLVRNGR